MRKTKRIVSKLVVLLMFAALFAATTFSAAAHSLTPWSKAYNYDNADRGSNHEFAIGDFYHISGRTFNYYWDDSWEDASLKNKTEEALKDGVALWDGMISVKETNRSEAHAVIRYDPEECKGIIYDGRDAAALVHTSRPSGHYVPGEVMTEMVIGDIVNYSLSEIAEVLCHELGHLWGIDDLYQHDGGGGKTDLDSIYSNTTGLISMPTRHDRNAMFIGINQPWFVDENNRVKYQKSVSASGVVTWAKNETYNGYIFDSNGYLTNTLKITYDANGGTKTPNPQYKVPGFNLRLSSDDLEFYEKYYTITIDPNGGELKTTKKEKIFCDFTGWNTSPTGGGTWYSPGQFYTSSYSDILYAQWKNPTASDSNLLDNIPKRPGYRFLDWNTSPTGDGKPVADNYTFTKDTTVYARWIARQYTIHYNANGGTVYPAAGYVKGDATTTLPTPTKRYVLTYDANGGNVSQTAKRVNCSFNGWYTASTGGTKRGNAGASYKPCSYDSLDQTLYAQWKNPTAGTLATPTRDGYVFAGWYTAPTGGTQVTDATTITADMTLYAHWGLADGLYSLKNSGSGQYLDISSSSNGAGCVQRPLDQATNSKWKITHLGNDEYELRPLLRLSSAMGLGNTGNVNGAAVGIWDTSSYPTYRWKITLNADGSWSLLSQASGYTKALAVTGSSAGAACTQQTPAGTPDEKWQMEPVNVLPVNEFISSSFRPGTQEWYSFRPTVSGKYTFFTKNATNNPRGTLIGTNYSEIGVIGDNFFIDADLNAGTTYYIKTEGVVSSESGSFDLGVFYGKSIFSIARLDAIRDDPSGDYFLIADIDFTGKDINWEPIPSFTGTLNGNGYTIKGLCVDRPAQNNVGLFGSLSGPVRDLTLDGIQITGGENTGGLAGSIDVGTTIYNCHITGNSSVTGGECTGGLVGFNKAAISNSSTTCSVEATGNFAGGLVGDNYNFITACHTTGSVDAVNYAGGLVGNNRREGSITGCSATGDINGLNRTGGLVGNNDGSIGRSYAIGDVAGGFNVGGFVGRNEKGQLASSYSTGTVDIIYDYGGGFVGYINQGEIRQCYSLSSVNGAQTKFMGGFVGYGDSENVRIMDSFSCANVQPSTNSAGFAGFMNGSIKNCYAVSDNETGFIKGGDATVTNCYFSNVYGGVDTKAAAKTPEEMRTLATYAGWDFGSIWELDEGAGYPTLQGMTKPSSFQNTGSTFTVDGLTYKITSPMTVQVGTGISPISVSGDVVIPSVVSNGTRSYTVTGIGVYAFNGRSLTSVTIPATVVRIETSAFQSCKSLTNVTFAAGSRLKTIGNHAFNGCSGLTGITIPVTVTSIGNNAFQSCTGLTGITFAAGSQLQSIGNHAFNGCFALTGVTLPNALTAIGSNAFTGCQALKTVSFEGDGQLKTLGSYAFYNCRNLEKVYLPLTLRQIGGYAFTFCEKLTSIMVPYGVEELPAKVFYGCSSLKEVNVPISVTSIAPDTFIGCNAVKLYVVPGSYAHTYAVEHNIACSAEP